MNFARNDFETAGHGHDHTRSVGLVVVRGGAIVGRAHRRWAASVVFESSIVQPISPINPGKSTVQC